MHGANNKNKKRVFISWSEFKQAAPVVKKKVRTSFVYCFICLIIYMFIIKLLPFH
jgi:hypothetical protein